MLASLYSLLVIVEMALAAFGVGRVVWSGLRREDDDLPSAVVWSLALGLIVCGLGIAALGVFGLLYKPVLAVLTLVAAFWGVGELMQLASAAMIERALSTVRREWPFVPQRATRPAIAWLGVAGIVAAAGALVCALAPPTAGDALCYHLELPKRWLIEHALTFLPDNDNCTYPLLAEMWYLWALALDGPVAAQLVHFGCGILAALAAVELARPIIGRHWCWGAGALVLLLPGVTNQMSAPLNDVALAALATLAVAAAWRGVFDDGGPEWFILAGLALGGALGTKLVGVLLVAALAVGLFIAWRKHPSRRTALWRGGLATAVVAASIAAPWYVRAAWYRGNPIYPLLGEWSGDGAKESLPASKAPLGRSLAGLAAAPWQVTMMPEQFGGRGHQLGPVLLMALPLLLCARRLRGLEWLLAVAAAYAVAWFLLRQNVRFLHAIVPVAAVPACWAIAEIGRWPARPRCAATCSVALVVAAGAVIPWTRAADTWQVAVGWESRDEYLARREPTFAAARILRDLGTTDANILSQEHRAFYFPCRVTRENLYRRRTRYDAALARPEEVCAVLRAAGFTHLLLAENVASEGVTYDATLRQLADAALAAGEEAPLSCLADYNFADQDGALRRYRLLLLR